VIKAPKNVKDWIAQKKYIFPLLAFVIPLIVRTIPEILMGPYIVGFDTMGFYVPNTMLWLHNGINFGDFLATAPLFYTILISIVAAGGSPVFVLKVIPPLLLGFLGLSMYAYAKRGLGWSPSKSAFVALFCGFKSLLGSTSRRAWFGFLFCCPTFALESKRQIVETLCSSFFSDGGCSVISSACIGPYVWSYRFYTCL
jgi:hypothetical protein